MFPYYDSDTFISLSLLDLLTRLHLRELSESCTPADTIRCGYFITEQYKREVLKIISQLSILIDRPDNDKSSEHLSLPELCESWTEVQTHLQI